ncbi:hypothetical protein HMPREF0293_0118 [Corynebacterium glucuronolyticum ATCC 51866]|uniref:Uncharacterized protein n=1 Tax=Corynebacterium glucuronolyticum ATCC 51866 TaxID=548478 RepID=A0ABM9XT78_9CORY|nr:hypothetical protein HMPREF0293_0118 [Corynebacterium glucuronolyticum ATCC 51866]
MHQSNGQIGVEHQIAGARTRQRTTPETTKPLLNRGLWAQAAFIIFDVFVSKIFSHPTGHAPVGFFVCQRG